MNRSKSFVFSLWVAENQKGPGFFRAELWQHLRFQKVRCIYALMNTSTSLPNKKGSGLFFFLLSKTNHASAFCCIVWLGVS